MATAGSAYLSFKNPLQKPTGDVTDIFFLQSMILTHKIISMNSIATSSGISTCFRAKIIKQPYQSKRVWPYNVFIYLFTLKLQKRFSQEQQEIF